MSARRLQTLERIEKELIEGTQSISKCFNELGKDRVTPKQVKDFQGHIGDGPF